jgi:RNA polymerase sigma factor (sigma-70 family)
LRTVLLSGEGATDAHLLECFLTHRDEAAFAALVQRHGRMVLAVCKRVLRHQQDAEDAFQATFLVLLRKAGSLEKRERLGNWLYGVAYRTALEAHSVNARRRSRESPTNPLPEPATAQAEPGGEWLPVLDRELIRLPEKYRVPVVLCELEGRPRHEVARMLAVPEGTLSSRLATARKKLAGRLRRHGITLSAVALAGVLGARAASATVPPSLMTATMGIVLGEATISAEVAALVEGVLKAMFLTKIKLTAVVLLLLAVSVTGFGVLTQQALADRLNPTAALPGREDKKPDKTEQGPTVHGVVKAIDADKHTITVTVGVDKKKETEEQTFTLASDVKVTLQDNLTKDQPPPAGKVADLTEGTGVALQLSVDKKSVVAISAHGPGLQGTVKSVDASKDSLTIGTKDKKGPVEHTVTLAKGAKVLLNDGLTKGTPDQEGKLSELSEGTSVLVQLSVDRKSALSVRVQGASVSGTLKGIDNGTRTVTVEVKEDGGLVEKMFTLAKEAMIEGNPNPGDTVVVQLSVFDKKMAVRVASRK